MAPGLITWQLEDTNVVVAGVTVPVFDVCVPDAERELRCPARHVPLDVVAAIGMPERKTGVSDLEFDPLRRLLDLLEPKRSM